MSARHTRDGYEMEVFDEHGVGVEDLMEGHALVPSMGWVRSVLPGGRHHFAEGIAAWTPAGYRPSVAQIVQRLAWEKFRDSMMSVKA